MPSPDIEPYELSPHVAPLVIERGRVVYTDETDAAVQAGLPALLRRRKVAICGAPGVRRVPWDDETFECWALNNFWNAARDSEGRLAASRWWEQHQITPDADGPDAGTPIQDANDMAWIRQCPVPLYTTEPVPENPNAVVWPVRSMARTFRDYFACSFAMQVAQAIVEEFEEIHIFGLQLLMGTQRETTVESSCLNWWLGLAEGRGIRVKVDVVHEPFLLRHPYRYGHEYWKERRWVERYLSVWTQRPGAI